MIVPVEFNDTLSKRKNDFAVCTIPANKYAMDHLSITRPLIVEYANKCRADYIELTGNQCPSYPMYNKYRLEQVTSTYQKTLYLDCDVAVNPIAPNVFDNFVEEKIYFYNEWVGLRNSNKLVFKGMNKEREQIIETFSWLSNEGREYIQPNCGVMLIPQTLSGIYSQPKLPYPKIWCFDQHYLILNLNKNQYEIIDWRYNLEFMINGFWDKIDQAYFIHLNGVKPDSRRLELLRQITNIIR